MYCQLPGSTSFGMNCKEYAGEDNRNKPNQKEQFKIPKERISKYFAPGTPAQKIEDTIVKALDFYRKRQREQER